MRIQIFETSIEWSDELQVLKNVEFQNIVATKMFEGAKIIIIIIIGFTCIAFTVLYNVTKSIKDLYPLEKTILMHVKKTEKTQNKRKKSMV